MEESRQFFNVMDADSDLRLVKNGNYRKLYAGSNGVTENRGVVTNVPSNLLVSNTLPSGTNKEIGAYEDFEGSSIIYCNFNSGGYHGIYRWFRNKQGFINGKIETIKQIKDPSVYTPFNENPFSFSDKSEFRITGCYVVDNYFFFTDNNSRSKFIDLDRANETEKRRKFNLYFNRNTFSASQNYTLNVYLAGTGLVGSMVWTSIGATYQEQNDDFIAAYQLSNLSNLFAAEDLNKFSRLTMNSVGEYYIQVLGDPTFPASVVPENFYPDNSPTVPSYPAFSRDLIDRLCYTPQCDPTVTYQTDNTISTNFVQNKVFQARVRYQYFDNSWSVYSAISTIPIQKSDGSVANTLVQDNYVLIDFSDPRLEDSALSSIVKKVEIAVQQPVLGQDWITITALEPYQFVGKGMQKYNFYNTETSVSIPLSATNKLFDALFIKHKSDEFVDDRGFAGDGLEGYDKIPLNAKVRIEYQQEQSSDNAFYTIKGTVEINNIWEGVAPLPAFSQPIYKIDNGDSVWGGFYGATGGLINTKNAADHNQKIPLDGFTVYLAGTPLCATTVQQLPQIANLASDPLTGVLLLRSTPLTSAEETALNTLKTQTIKHNFTISGVLAGKYILRIAGHEITALDLNAQTLDYQKTSTNTVYIKGASATVYPYELEIDVSANVTGIKAIVLDMAATNTASVTGYLCDNDDPLLTGTSILDDTRIHKAEMLWDTNASYNPFLNQTLIPSPIMPVIFRNHKSITDHNGYYFFALKRDAGAPTPIPIGLTSLQVGNHPSSAPQLLLSDGTTPFGGTVPNQSGVKTIFRNLDSNVTGFSKTYLNGTMVDSASQSPLIDYALTLAASTTAQQVATTSGNLPVHVGSSFGRTDALGNFNIPLYAIAFTRNGYGRLFFNSAAGTTLYSVNQSLNPSVVTISIDDHSSNSSYYDKSFQYQYGTISNIVAVLATLIGRSYWKRGSDRYFGIVYADEGDRKTAVCLIDQKVHITFYTEPDENGVLQPTGAANIFVDINNEPPEWATKYYIVAMKNQQHEDHLVWIANLVHYTNSAGTTVTYTDPTVAFCVISLDNIGYYTSHQHPNSLVAYTFQAGDRIRFMKNFAGVYYNKYFDYEILKATPTEITIPYDNRIQFSPAVSFELYTPKTTDQTKIFYEIGHCGEVKSAVFNGVLKKYHTGNIQNQSYPAFGAPITNNAAITKLEWGDVYYRLRKIGYNVATFPVPFRVVNVTDDSISDFFPSRIIGWGRPNTDAIMQGQKKRGSTSRFSNRYISGTLINGLRNFEDLNQKQFSTTYGDILKLQLVNKTVLKAIFSNSFMVSMYINQGVLRTANGSTLVSISDDVIAQTHEMQRNFGTLNPESIALNDEADLFGWDENLGVVWRSSGNALEDISSLLMYRVFTEIGNQRNTLGRNNSEVISVYDNNSDMLIITFRPMLPKVEIKSKCIVNLADFARTVTGSMVIRLQPLGIIFGTSYFNTDPNFPNITAMINSIINSYGQGWSATTDAYGNSAIESPDGSSAYYNQTLVITINAVDYPFVFTNGSIAGTGTLYDGETIAFCKSKRGWTEYYPFVPEGYGRLRMDYVSFVNGELWLHGDKSKYNNFYGTQYSRTLTVPFNKDFEKVKTLKNIEVNTDTPCYCPTITIPSNDQNSSGMATEITQPAFKVVLGKYFAKIPMDKLTPWIPNVQQAWVSGRPLRGQVAVAEISTDSDELAPIIEAKMGYFFEELS